MIRKKRLGKGLGSLIGDIEGVASVSDEGRADGMVELGVDQIRCGDYQPRQHFDQAALESLAESIRLHGIVQPLLVRLQGAHYELIAGERRWRAAQLIGLEKVPVMIRQQDSQSAAAIALIENIQREDLNPLEEAQAFLRLIEEFNLTHQKVADSVGRSRASVSNFLRLLELADPVKEKMNQGLLDMGHARALLALPRQDQIRVSSLIVKRGLSVRGTESLVKQTLNQKPSVTVTNAADPDIQRLESDMSEKLGAAVKIKSTKEGAWQLTIHFHSSDEMEGILQHLLPST